ncbi:hypothetical protein BDU57DRAFT_519424 [Ampelomyces quisqualis]|uniref:Uncharacterized protein n=1 Tax=Ampelomyces quisqualis TaxID=50730 RepID=A0A6A5QK34_AMPQU|nr:hypothetical protein BDU57DRAFT_519424 [Ampelomyces quisqualis]
MRHQTLIRPKSVVSPAAHSLLEFQTFSIPLLTYKGTAHWTSFTRLGNVLHSVKESCSADCQALDLARTSFAQGLLLSKVSRFFDYRRTWLSTGDQYCELSLEITRSLHTIDGPPIAYLTALPPELHTSSPYSNVTGSDPLRSGLQVCLQIGSKYSLHSANTTYKLVQS